MYLFAVAGILARGVAVVAHGQVASADSKVARALAEQQEHFSCKQLSVVANEARAGDRTALEAAVILRQFGYDCSLGGSDELNAAIRQAGSLSLPLLAKWRDRPYRLDGPLTKNPPRLPPRERREAFDLLSATIAGRRVSGTTDTVAQLAMPVLLALAERGDREGRIPELMPAFSQLASNQTGSSDEALAKHI